MEVVGSTEDLLTEILVRVPARPLVRFKCVSKHWLSLISNPKFCYRHTLQNPRSSVSAVFPRTSSRSIALSFIPLDDLDHDPTSNKNPSKSSNCNTLKLLPNLRDEITILHSCNGLFLCCGPLRIREKPSYYYVLNPTTNQFSTLIPPSATTTTSFGPSCKILNQALVFDPSRSPHYKVLVFCHKYEDSYHIVTTYQLIFYIDIYTSVTKSWRRVDSYFSIPYDFVFGLDGEYGESGLVYCNGAVHWVDCQKQVAYYHIDDERVGYVDFDTDDFEFSESNWARPLSNSSFLQESHCGSHLHFIDINKSRIEVSEMKRDYSGWCLKYCIDLTRIFPTTFRPRSEKDFAVLFLTPQETELLLHIPGRVISYNLKTKISTSFQLSPRQGIDDSKLRVKHQNFRYMETLTCV